MHRIYYMHGEDLGDKVLQTFGRACDATLRPYDIAGRIAAEEFALLLPETHVLDTHTVISRISANFRRHLDEKLIVLNEVQLEVGMAAFPFDAESAMGLFEAALPTTKLELR
jgi:diguanylate cyclase (GGDEF)-like protein